VACHNDGLDRRIVDHVLIFRGQGQIVIGFQIANQFRLPGDAPDIANAIAFSLDRFHMNPAPPAQPDNGGVYHVFISFYS
jgi:hypothetical protein